MRCRSDPAGCEAERAAIIDGLREERRQNQEPKGNPQQRYNLLFGLAKQLASRASQNEELTEEYAQCLRAMLAEMIVLPPEDGFQGINQVSDTSNPDVHVIDVVDERGRPSFR